MNQIKIEIPLISHIEKTQNKFAPNKFTKIAGNLLYSQSIGRFQRAIVMDNMHEYISTYLSKYNGLNLSKTSKITYNYYAVRNFGSISYRIDKKTKIGRICWKPVKANYKINWDLPNLNLIWQKAIEDALVLSKVIEDDNADILYDFNYKLIIVEDITEMKIEIIIDY